MHLYHRFHERFGTAGVMLGVIALILALGGTALAAKGALTGKQKKEVEKIAKKFQGTGPQGSPGTNGTNGTNGENGKSLNLTKITNTGLDGKCVGLGGTKVEVEGDASSKEYLCNGEKGAQGTAGKNIVTGPEATGTGNCGGRGGVSVEVQDSGTKEYVCNGEKGADGTNGSPWVVGQAPARAILKGTWSIQQFTASGAGENVPVPISTGVPIASIAGNLVAAARGAGLDNGGNAANAESLCPGTAENPTINTSILELINLGGLCVYAQEQTNLAPPEYGFAGSSFVLPESGAGTVALFKSAAAGGANAYGSWVIFTPPSP